jgi:hypothetical protein
MYNLNTQYHQVKETSSYTKKEDLALNCQTWIMSAVAGGLLTLYLGKNYIDNSEEYCALKQEFESNPTGAMVKKWDEIISDLESAKKELEGYIVREGPRRHYHPPDEAAAIKFIEAVKNKLNSDYTYSGTDIASKLENLELDSSNRYKDAILELKSVINSANQVRGEYLEEIKPLFEKMNRARGSATDYAFGTLVSGFGTLIASYNALRKIKEHSSSIQN